LFGARVPVLYDAKKEKNPFSCFIAGWFTVQVPGQSAVVCWPKKKNIPFYKTSRKSPFSASGKTIFSCQEKSVLHFFVLRSLTGMVIPTGVNN
jgi:hypothetical protein